MDKDRNLLFGIFAVQLGKVTASQLVEAGGAWATDRSKDLPQRLIEAGFFSEKDLNFISDIVERAVESELNI